MLINRRDLEYILKVMDKFSMIDPWDGVTIHHQEHPAGYDLSVSFGDLINGTLCRLTVPITEDMFESE